MGQSFKERSSYILVSLWTLGFTLGMTWTAIAGPLSLRQASNVQRALGCRTKLIRNSTDTSSSANLTLFIVWVDHAS